MAITRVFNNFSVGPTSEVVKAQVRFIDAEIGVLMKSLSDEDLSSSVNVLITTEHGMADVSESTTIALANYTNFDDLSWSYLEAFGLIQPKPGKLEKVS